MLQLAFREALAKDCEKSFGEPVDWPFHAEHYGGLAHWSVPKCVL